MLTQEPLYVITKPDKVRNPMKTRRGNQKPIKIRGKSRGNRESYSYRGGKAMDMIDSLQRITKDR